MKAPNTNMNQAHDVRPFTAWIGLTVAACSGTVAVAGPAGLSVQSGTATATASGPHLDITASQNAVLQWQSFNVGAGESVRF